MITTFYSYKGGVGRSQCVANLATYLSIYKGRKILLIDWDLEAPGLHFYFGISEKNTSEGLIDYLSEYTRMVISGDDLEEEDLPKLDKKYITQDILKAKDDTEGQIDLIPAGKYDEEYAAKLNDFDWKEFYEQLDGKLFIELFKEQLLAMGYDHIFIDSRTGTNDYSGICNIQMPEINVLIAAPTKQNFEGCKRIANSILESPYLKTGLRNRSIIFPVLSRLDLSISGKSEEWGQIFRDEFYFLTENLQKEIHNFNELTYYNETLLDYKRDLAYGEPLLFREEKTYLEGLESQYANLGKYLEKTNQKFSRIDESVFDKIKRLISEGKISKAIGKLEELANNTDLESSLILLASRYSRLRREEQIGKIDNESYSSEESRILNALLEILGELEQNFYSADKGEHKQKNEEFNILFLSAGRDSSSKLSFDKVYREINNGLSLSRNRGKFSLSNRWFVNFRDLRRLLLNETPQILIFYAHQTDIEPGIYLEDDFGNSNKSDQKSGKKIDADIFIKLLSLFEEKLEGIIFINCCDSSYGKIAQLGPHIIGSNNLSEDHVSIFLSGFMDALGSGKDIEFSFRSAKMGLEIEGIESESMFFKGEK